MAWTTTHDRRRLGLRGTAWRVTSIATAGWIALLLFLAVTRYGGDPRAFLCLGLNFSHPAGLAGAPRTSSWGYDGQFFAVLATDPLVLDPATAESLDAPAYRSRRILLPLVAWLVTFGRDTAAPFAYLVLCWSIGLAGVGLLAIWLERAGRSPWLALLYAASGGVVVSFLRATPDAAVTALVLAGLWTARAGRDRSAVAALTAAALARETAVLAAVAVAAAELRCGRWRRAAVLAVVPTAAAGAWAAFAALRFGAHAAAGAHNFAPPFAAMADRIALLVAGKLAPVEALGLAAVAAAVVAGAALLARDGRTPAALSLAAFAALAAVLGASVWTEAYAFLRVLCVLPALALAALAESRHRWCSALLLAAAVLSAVAGLLLVKIELAPVVPLLADLKGLAATVLRRCC